MHLKIEIPSLARRLGVSVLIGLCIAAIGSALEAIIERHSMIGVQLIDDFTVGIIVAVLVFAYEQRRHRSILNKIRVITAMNHHVRNALQTIAYAPYAEQKKQIKLIEDAVNRIQWALREILPAQESAPDTLFVHTSAPHPVQSATERDKSPT